MSAPGGFSRFLSDMFFENVGLKFVSILCAIGFFVFIRGSERAEMRFEVGVEHNQPPDSARRILVQEPPPRISVTLQGPRAQLEALSRDLGTTIRLDLSTGYESVIELTPDMIPNLPTGVKVVQLYPQRIEVRWDDIISRSIPVEQPRSGAPKPGYHLAGQVQTDPSSVIATGPRSIVELLQTARASNFDLSDLDEGREDRTMKLELPPQGVEYSVTGVRATAEVVREKKTVPFKAVRVEVVGAPKATTRPETVTINIRGYNEIVDLVTTEHVVPRVHLPESVDLTKPNSMMVPVVVDIPDVEVDILPKEVLVKW